MGGGLLSTLRALVCVCVLLVLSSIAVITNGAREGQLSAYQMAVFRADPDKDLDHFVVSNASGTDYVYVGGDSVVFLLDTGLNHIRNTSMEPENCGRPCYNPTHILTIAPAPVNRLLVCKGVDGLCVYMDLQDLRETADSSWYVTVAGSAEPFVGLVYMYKTEGYFYVGASNSEEFPHRDGSDQAYAITQRSIQGDYLFNYDTASKIVKDNFYVSYLQGIIWRDFMFLVVNESDETDGDVTRTRSKLGRFCLTYPDKLTHFDPYLEIPISCGSSPTMMIKAAHIGPAGPELASSLGVSASDDVLYAVFSDVSALQSALCIYTMDDIETKYVDAAYGCGSSSAPSGLGQDIKYFEISTSCDQSNNDFSRSSLDEEIICTGRYRPIPALEVDAFTYAEAQQELQGHASYTDLPGTQASMITMTRENQTVAFVLSTEGVLNKLHIESNNRTRLYETIDLSVSKDALRDIYLDEEKEKLYVLTKGELIKVDIINCTQHTTCEECIGPSINDGDPFCGWCSLNNKCTRRKQTECSGAGQGSRWLTYNDECIAIQNVNPPSQYLRSPPQDVTFTVTSLPSLDAGNKYFCQFPDISQAPSSRVGDTFTCQTPAIEERPTLGPGEDSTTMTLAVYNDQTDMVIVEHEYPFFNCSAITQCLPCVTSEWGCEWCVYSYTCTHQRSSDCTSSNEIIVSHNDTATCPQMDAFTSQMFIPVGFPRDVTLTGRNLPNNQVSYQCRVTIQGFLKKVAATLTDPSTVVCMEAEYEYDSSGGILELNVSVSVEYNSGHVIDDEYDNTVTLYDCAAIGSSCSSCIAPSVRANLTCGWCENQCQIREAECMNFLDQSGSSICPPPQITGFNPKSGPIEGNTVVTIKGTDLGKEISEIVGVHIDGLVCDHTQPDLTYEPGVSVQCMTSATGSVAAGGIKVTVQRTVGNMTENYTATYDAEQFSYKDPSLTGFAPIAGIMGGGTLVRVTGTDLDIGNGRQVVIGGVACTEVAGSLSASSLECHTGMVSTRGNVSVSIEFDAGMREAPGTYSYGANPEVYGFTPTASVAAGGIELTVEGLHFAAVQSKQLILIQDGEEISQDCVDVDSPELMNTLFKCVTPKLNSSNTTRRRRATTTTYNIRFQFDGFTDETREITYCPDPNYEPLTEVRQLQESVTQMELMGSNLECGDVGSEPIEVCVGTGRGTISSISEATLTFLIPNPQPNAGGCDGEPLDGCQEGLPCIVVRHGLNLNFTVGSVRYPVATAGSLPVIVGCVVGIIGFAILLFLLYALLSRRIYVAETGKIKKQMDTFIEMSKGQVIDGFFRDQEMSDIEEQLQGLGMPFVTNHDYMKSMLFFGLDVKPQAEEPNNPSETEERAMLEFSKLLSKRDFLRVFIRTLDQCKKLTTKERANIASLLTVALVMEGKFTYLTDVLKSLMSDTIAEASERRRLKQLFKRTETIEDKLLTNWIALAMFKFVKESVGHPLYMLYQAIKIHCEKGPVDAITGQSFFSLNFDNLLTETCDFEELTLQVTSELGEETVKVLDVDTITQVKEKILDAMYRKKHTKFQRNAQEVDLVIRSGKAGQLVLSDKDHTTQASMGWCELNTLKHYGINNNTEVSLATRQDMPNAMPVPLIEDAENLFCNAGASARDNDLRQSRRVSGLHHDYHHVQDTIEEGIKLFHLTQKYDDEAEEEESEEGCWASIKRFLFFNVTHTHREIKEIHLQRLVSVQQSITNFVEDALNAMFTIREDQYINNINNVPFALRFLFNFFDEEASRYEDESSTAFSWKNNTLPLRFWATILAHPSFIFNMRQSRSADASVIVLTQMLDSACKGVVPKLKMNASPSRLMFNKDLQRYIELISIYYHNIKQTPVLQEDELRQECQRIDDEFVGLFSRLATLRQLYDFIRPHEDLLVEALVEDEKCKAARFASSLERVGSTLDEPED